MLTVLKIGGSIITDKSRPYSIRKDIIKRIAREVKPYVETSNKLVIIHGGGSYGHYIVDLHKKLGKEEDAEYYSKVTIAMNELSIRVAELFRIEHLPVTVIASHTLFELDGNGNIIAHDLSIIQRHLDKGIIPMLYGDLVLGEKGFPVLSGDDIGWYLACKLNAKRLLFATSVDGIYAGPIGRSPIIDVIDFRENGTINAFFNNTQDVPVYGYDVTGGIWNKIRSARKYRCKNLDVLIFNGLVEDNIRKALLGERIVGTRVLL